ncbi:hypothetical protein N7478_010416 [Penicillium angulare]|uniref:uncharacterized protein n=1 Tax=Penicillium angulare TaxID=116970 RepID=UPI00253F8529|nr:uncharacterized protein N7478_010416 [Penicillium angulare]KAJ5267608.1 hypothetical protein N7478_010416 [Penicillium angulare]
MNCFEEEGVKSYINDLRGGREVLVDHIYGRLLEMLFPWGEGFLHEREDYPSPASQKQSDVTLSAVINQRRKKLIIIESKREVQRSTTGPTKRAWSGAESQLRKFCQVAYKDQGSLPENLPLFVAIAIGSQIKFAEFSLLEIREGNRTLETSQLRYSTGALSLISPEGQAKIQLTLENLKGQIDLVLQSLKTPATETPATEAQASSS